MTWDNLFNDGYDQLVTKLQTATSLTVVNDPRNINPPCILLQAPSFIMHTNVVPEMQFQITVIGTGPGNRNALTQLLSLADRIRQAKIGLIEGRPVVQQIGGAEYPAYEMTISTKVAP
jgi:hypothetical protein